jgi:hypothetical protein
MSVFRKFSTLALWLILIVAIITGFLWFTTRIPGNTDTRISLPQSTALIFECASFTTLVSELHANNKIWNEISSSGLFEGAALSLNKLDSLIKKDSQIAGFLNKKISISISLKANKTAGIIFSLPESVRKQDKLVLNILAKQLANFSYVKRRYERNTIYDLSWKDASGIRFFSFTVLKGVMLGSFSSELVEESIRNFNPEKNFTRQPEFASITRTIGNKVSGNVFVNYENASEILKYYLNPTFSKNMTGMNNFASWGALDAEIYTDKLIFNGFTSTNDSLNNELKIFKGQEPIEFNSPSFLPGSISYFKAYGFSNKDLFFKKLSDCLIRDAESKELLTRKKALLIDYGIDLDKVFSEMISDEYGYASMQSGRTSHPFFFMELKSQSLAQQQFKEWLTSWALKNGRSPKELMMDYKIDNNNTLTVFKLPIGGIPSMVFGRAFKSPENDYFTFINNYLVFANSYSSIKEFLYQVVLGNTLATSAAYSSLGENSSSRSNIYIFVKPGSVAESSDDIISEPTQEMIHKSKESISKFSAISIQYSAADELFYNHVFINYSGVFSGSVKTVWESRIDTTTVFKPEIVKNHLTGEKEIIIQDQKNQLYLLSNAGIILWKQMLDGPLKSEVFQVDYFKNGKLQYLFNTANKIYMLDRNGNPVEKFPIVLRSPATAGLSVFDYDNDGTIRICLPGEDRKIYMYDKEGKIIPGWKPEHTDNEVLLPLQHFRVGSKDYIVAIDKYKFYILDRKGKNRVTVKKYFQVSSNNGFYLDISRGENQARLVTTDTSGSIIRVYFSGKVEKILERKLDPGHFFIYSDLDGDQKGEFLTATGNTLQVLKPNLDESFKVEFNEPISFQPVIYKFSEKDNKIGIVLRNPGYIYLYNNNGTLYNGFPLEGSAPFSISSFPELGGRFSMIVGSKNNFLYNYSVQ